jgi:ATP-binding cassette subfamily B protein
MRESWRATRLLVGIVVRAYPGLAAAAVAVTALGELVIPARAVTLRFLVDAAGRGNDRGIAVAAALLAGTIGLEVVVQWVGLHLRTGVRERAVLALDAHLAGLSSGVRGIEHHERAEFLDRLTVLRDQHLALSGLQEAVVWNVALILRLLGTVLLLGAVHPILLALPLCAVPSLAIGAKVEAARQRVQEDVAPRRRLEYRLFGLATRPEAGKELRVFGLAPELLARYRAVRADVDRLEDAVGLRAALQSVAGWLLFGGAFVAAVIFVGAQVSGGRATPGQLVLTLTLAGQLNGQVAGLVSMVSWMLGTLVTARRLVWLTDYAAADHARTVPVALRPVPSRLERGIDFDGVRFRYPGTDVDVLEGVTLSLPAGATVALVGDNGAGKTTLVKLLCRFYDPTSGSIQVDGVGLHCFDVDAWRSRIAAAFQDFSRLELAACDAIGVGDLPRIHDRAAVRAAARQAGALGVIAGLPAGFDTCLGPSFEGGVDLSTGQWQRLALARAFMRRDPLLNVLDEPTAALDPAAEDMIFERYAEAGRRAAAGAGAVTILVSHRLATARLADLVIVLRRGRVVEFGSHQELVGARGPYAELYELQARSYR